jgi:hypothetical protein
MVTGQQAGYNEARKGDCSRFLTNAYCDYFLSSKIHARIVGLPQSTPAVLQITRWIRTKTRELLVIS